MRRIKIIQRAAAIVFSIATLSTLAILTLVPGSSLAQERVGYYDYMRPDLEWYSIETQHFLIHFHVDSTGRGSDRTAGVVARIAEDIYGPITSLYQLEPDSKVSIVLKDYEDYSNGAAYFFDNKIDIWAPSLASPLRGENAWLRNVITHEFTHIVQVQKTMKGSRKWPFYYIQWLAYEDVRRPDVLYGYPDVIVSYPVPVLNNPAWFAEGTAQFQRSDLHYDTWDTHRDMLLRSRFLGNEDLSISEMGDLHSKTSLEREQVYNQGFAFTTHLANEYGEESLREISDRLGNWLNWTIESAMKDALDEPGSEVFDRWADQVQEQYAAATEKIRANPTKALVIEDGGAFNFSPRFSPDGKRIAYASSKGGDYSRTNLYVTGTDSSDGFAVEIGGSGDGSRGGSLACTLGEPLAAVTGSIDWAPDGQKIVYARTRDTKLGHRYADLYELDVETKDVHRITHEARATSPSYSPDGTRIVFVGQSDGSTNLYLIEVDGGAKIDSVPKAEAESNVEKLEAQRLRLTSFEDGTQVYSPRWSPDGSTIYFAAGPGPAPGPGRHSNPGNRDIFSIKPGGSDLRTVLVSSSDERDPMVSPDGKWLYFSSDRTGIFNVNRVSLAVSGTEKTQTEQLTNVLGGAFEPDVSADGRLVFSQFGVDGYQIATLETPVPVEAIEYAVPEILKKKPGTIDQSDEEKDVLLALNSYDDSDLTGWPIAVYKSIGDSSLADSEVVPSRYSDTFSSFQFFPVLRFDMYADADRAGIDTPGGSSFQGGELLRNTKVGLYMVSREILSGLSFSAGLSVGLWSKPWDSFGEFISPSRFDKLERDVFLRFDYRKGLPFFKKRWAPQLSVEFFNVVRNVENGLAIEEFPCTACFPDTSYVDISYSLWEVDIYSRSKLSRAAMLEVGYRYSPYRARTETFFSTEQGISIPASSTRYFIGHAIGTKLYLEALKPHLNSDILPVGWRAEIGYEFQPGQLLDDFTVENGALVPQYLSFKNHQFIADLRLGWKLPFGGRSAPHGLGIRARGVTIVGGEVDSFFNDYVGGLVGARGYPFYALGGNETLWFQLAYQFPIFPRIGKQLMFLHLNKLYARIFGDAAAAWTTGVPGIDEVRTDIGAELRLGISSFYLLPTAAFLSASYGFNEFVIKLDDGFVTPDGSQFVKYGHQVLWHFGVLFEFGL